MSKYFSWKINDEQYAYLYIPNNKNHISSRITDVDVINKMIYRISQWDEKKYKTAFDSMNEEVVNTFGVNIPYSDSYFTGVDNNVVIMGSSKSDVKEIDDLKNELLDVIDERFAEIKNTINELNEELIKLFNKRTIDSVKASREDFDSMLAKFSVSKEDLENKFNKATKTLEKAAKVLELDNNEINSDSLKDLFKVTNKNEEWITTYSGDVETIKKDYKEYEESLPQTEKGRGFFKLMSENVQKVQNDVVKISNINTELKDSLTSIKAEQEMNFKLLQQEQNAKILGSRSLDINNITKGDYNIKIDDNNITLSNIKNNSSIILDDDGIKINGNIFINGNKL